MKGPGLRIDLDVRRLWECPACQRQDRFDGDVVAARCSCREGGVTMRLVESRRQVRKFDIPASSPDHSSPSSVSEGEASAPRDSAAASGDVASAEQLAVDAIMPHPPSDGSNGGEATPVVAAPNTPDDAAPPV